MWIRIGGINKKTALKTWFSGLFMAVYCKDNFDNQYTFAVCTIYYFEFSVYYNTHCIFLMRRIHFVLELVPIMY